MTSLNDIKILQHCDFCKAIAVYDAKSHMGPWAFMCEEHYQQFGSKTPGLFNVLNRPPQEKCTISEKEVHTHFGHLFIKCPECGKEFFNRGAAQSAYRIGKRTYCSYPCFRKVQTETENAKEFAKLNRQKRKDDAL